MFKFNLVILKSHFGLSLAWCSGNSPLIRIRPKGFWSCFLDSDTKNNWIQLYLNRFKSKLFLQVDHYSPKKLFWSRLKASLKKKELCSKAFCSVACFSVERHSRFRFRSFSFSVFFRNFFPTAFCRLVSKVTFLNDDPLFRRFWKEVLDCFFSGRERVLEQSVKVWTKSFSPNSWSHSLEKTI